MGGGPASEAWFGGGYGGGSGINDINAILSAFGYGGCANIAEWAALKDKIREFNATLEASGIGYRINDKGQFEKEWNVGGIYAYADDCFAILRLRQCFKCNLPKKDVLSYLVLTRVIRKK